jgi:hypothetical protein
VTAGHLRPAGLELWFHQQHQPSARGDDRREHRDHLRQRDERQVGDRELRNERQLFGHQGPDVAALDHGHTIAVADPGVQLSVAHVERDHVGCPSLEQAVGEPAGGRPRIEDACASDVERERL